MLSMRNQHGIVGLSLLMVVVWLTGCDNMRDGNRYKPYEASPFFQDTRSSRPLVEGALPRGFLREDEAFYTGALQGQQVVKIPMPVDEALILRGHNRYNIHCIVCHGATGLGNGLVVDRGFNQPPSFYDDRLLKSPAGHYYDVITNGYGVMSSYAKEISPEDRWAIVAYIQHLQSLHANENKVGDKEEQAAPEESDIHSVPMESRYDPSFIGL